MPVTSLRTLCPRPILRGPSPVAISGRPTPTVSCSKQGVGGEGTGDKRFIQSALSVPCAPDPLQTPGRRDEEQRREYERARKARWRSTIKAEGRREKRSPCSIESRRRHDRRKQARRRLDPIYQARERVRRAARVLRLRAVVDAIKACPCVDCSQSFPPEAMDFDHRPGETKIASIAQLVAAGRPWRVIEVEIAKCDLVCASCHRVRTRFRRTIDRGRSPVA